MKDMGLSGVELAIRLDVEFLCAFSDVRLSYNCLTRRESRQMLCVTPGYRNFSAPPEQLLDVGKLQFHIGRPAVIALAAVGRGFHLASSQSLLHKSQSLIQRSCDDLLIDRLH